MINFDNSDEENAVITCQTTSNQPNSNDYYGNRGLFVTIDSGYTNFSRLALATPSANAQMTWLDIASYNYQNSTTATVWLTGYLAPAISSEYLFSLDTNAEAIFYLSTDNTSANKVTKQNMYY